MNVVGLFAGIGGFELGLERSGHQTIMLCESDPAATCVLRKEFAGVELRSDVRTRRSLPSDTELLAAGFPCQDLSQVGTGRGLRGNNSGLVEEVFRRLRRKRIPWVLLENVPFMLWQKRGRALRWILDCFEELGYAWAYRVLDSRSFGLPQRRERVFILAARTGDPRDVLLGEDQGPPVELALNGASRAMGFYWTEGNRGLGRADDAIPTLKGGSGLAIPSAPAIWLQTGEYEIVTPSIRDAERLQGFPVDWTKPADGVGRRSLRWRLVGNAVTVDVAAWIGSALVSPSRYDGSVDRLLRPSDRFPRAAWGLGKTRHVSRVSAWPVQRPFQPLTDFLKYECQPLSARATAGFKGRLEASRLDKPAGFIAALGRHYSRMMEVAVEGDVAARTNGARGQN